MTRPRAGPTDLAIGLRIKRLRRAGGISQASLATSLGISTAQFLNYENGKHRIPAGRLRAIAEVLGADIEAFMPPRTNPAIIVELTRFLMLPGAIELVQGFQNIEDRAIREAVVDLAMAIAASYGGEV